MDEIIRIILATENKEYGLTLTASLSASRNISVLTTTCDGNELVEYTKLLQPDIIIADLYLAHMNSVAAYNEISAMNLAKTPALFLLLPYDISFPISHPDSY